MTPPPPRIREVLSVMRDLSPLEARALLAQVVATLDQVELLALRNSLPAAALNLLPGCVGVAIEPGAAGSAGESVATVPVAAAPSAPRGVGAWATGPVLPGPLAAAASVPSGASGFSAAAPAVSCGLGVATIPLFAGVAGPPALPSYAVATAMNLAPMPWELPEPPAVLPATPAVPVPGTETGKLIAAAVPSSRKRVRNAVAVLACALGLGLASSLLGSNSEAPAAAPAEPVIAATATAAATAEADDDEVVSLVPPPPAREYATISAAKVGKVKKTISRSTTRKPAPTVGRSQPAEWASPFERRH